MPGYRVFERPKLSSGPGAKPPTPTPHPNLNLHGAPHPTPDHPAVALPPTRVPQPLPQSVHAPLVWANFPAPPFPFRTRAKYTSNLNPCHCCPADRVPLPLPPHVLFPCLCRAQARETEARAQKTAERLQTVEAENVALTQRITTLEEAQWAPKVLRDLRDVVGAREMQGPLRTDEGVALVRAVQELVGEKATLARRVRELEGDARAQWEAKSEELAVAQAKYEGLLRASAEMEGRYHAEVARSAETKAEAAICMETFVGNMEREVQELSRTAITQVFGVLESRACQGWGRGAGSNPVHPKGLPFTV